MTGCTPPFESGRIHGAKGYHAYTHRREVGSNKNFRPQPSVHAVDK